MTRCGIGYDIHRLGQNRKLILGGVEIPYLLGLEGHSDADVLSHAIADALLGAVCAGDIGQHFPDPDESIRGISSIEILKRVTQMLADKKARVVNIDATVIAEAPKIAPHIPAMRKETAKAIGISDTQVSIKATTNERLGPIGRGEGISDGDCDGRTKLRCRCASLILTRANSKNSSRATRRIARSTSTPAGRRFTAAPTSATFAPTFSKICFSAISKRGTT